MSYAKWRPFCPGGDELRQAWVAGLLCIIERVHWNALFHTTNVFTQLGIVLQIKEISAVCIEILMSIVLNDRYREHGLAENAIF